MIRYMGEQLPYYMLPSRILKLEEMPLTHNGKVDDNQLPFPEEAISGREAAMTFNEHCWIFFHRYSTMTN